MTYTIYHDEFDYKEVVASSFREALFTVRELYFVEEHTIDCIDLNDSVTVSREDHDELEEQKEQLESEIETLREDMSDLRDQLEKKLEEDEDYIRYKTLAEEYLKIKEFTEVKTKELSAEINFTYKT